MSIEVYTTVNLIRVVAVKLSIAGNDLCEVAAGSSARRCGSLARGRESSAVVVDSFFSAVYLYVAIQVRCSYARVAACVGVLCAICRHFSGSPTIRIDQSAAACSMASSTQSGKFVKPSSSTQS
jgi:hypothetical protein